MPLGELERRYVLAVRRLVHAKDGEFARLRGPDFDDVAAVMDSDGQPRHLEEFMAIAPALSVTTVPESAEAPKQEPQGVTISSDELEHPGKLASALGGSLIKVVPIKKAG